MSQNLAMGNETLGFFLKGGVYKFISESADVGGCRDHSWMQRTGIDVSSGATFERPIRCKCLVYRHGGQ